MDLLHRPWTLVFLAGFLVYVSIRHVHQARVEGQEIIERRVDATEKVLLAVVFVGSLLLPILYVFTSLLSFADYELPRFAPWCGTAIMVVALWLFRRSHADLGKNWSVTLEVRRGHRLVTHGVYRAIRHPMYASIWLWALAQGLLLENWLAGWSALLTFAPLYFRRVPREEWMMREFFGEEYRAYARMTGRILPRMNRRPK